MCIGVVAVVLIATVIVIGLVLNKRQNASPVSDHPTSTNSTSSVSNGVITVTAGSPTFTVDLYEDGLCADCQTFEDQYGQQMMKYVDEGKLAIRYHFMSFLDANSASKNYSTRIAAAFECVAAAPATSRGLLMNFHTTMFRSGVQPARNGTADLSNSQIAALAVNAGAPASAASCITAGTNIAQATTTAAAAVVTLSAAVPQGAYATPAVIANGKLLNLNNIDWLSGLIP